MRNAFLLAFLVLLSASAWAQTSGNQLFDSHSARCHGIGGTGGEGPSLTRLVLRHAGDDEALSSVIVNGIPNSDMPGNWMLGTNDVKAVAKYVRSLGRAEEEPVPGDADKGRRLYEGKSAWNICHIVAGEGGVIGPDLSNIGIVRGLADLREALVTPGANVSFELCRCDCANQRRRGAERPSRQRGFVHGSTEGRVWALSLARQVGARLFRKEDWRKFDAELRG